MSTRQSQPHGKLCNHFIALAVWALLTLFLSIAGLAASPHSLDLATVLAQRIKMSANTATDLEADLNNGQHLRLIVRLQPPAKVDKQASLAQVHTHVKRVQDELLESVSQHLQSRVKRFATSPYLAMTVDAQGLRAVVAHPQVVQVYRDDMYKPMLAESVSLIGASQAHESGVSGTGWAVAVLDTGVDSTHPFLDEGKVVFEACYSSTDATQGVSSTCPSGQDEQEGPGAGASCDPSVEGCDHGTHVAAIAAGAAMGTNVPELGGVAPGAQIIAMQVFSRIDNPAICGSPMPCVRFWNSDLMQALERVYSLRQTFPIAAVNMSLGGGQFMNHCDAESPLADVMARLWQAGIAPVVASGNESLIDSMSHPACVSSAISVGSTTKYDEVSSFSNSAGFLSLLAPGQEIVSAVPGSQLGAKSGTSMAAPHVAGSFALLRQVHPTASVDELLGVLQETGYAISDWRNGLVTPSIDVGEALSVLRGAGVLAGTSR